MGKIIAKVEMELKDFIPEYLANRGQDLVQIKICLEGGEFEPIRRLAHRLKGSGGGYGFDGLTAIGAAMEAAAIAGDGDEIRRQALALEDYLNGVEIEYV